MVGDKPFPFQMVAEDWEGKTVAFERPLLCVPLEGHRIGERISKGSAPDLLTRPTWSGAPPRPTRNPSLLPKPRPMTGARLRSKPTQSCPRRSRSWAARSRNCPSLTRCSSPPSKSARVSVPALERLLGRPSPVEITFDSVYLTSGMEPEVNKGEVYARLVQTLDLPFASEKAGWPGQARHIHQGSVGHSARSLTPMQSAKAVLTPACLARRVSWGGLPLRRFSPRAALTRPTSRPRAACPWSSCRRASPTPF